jgi:hypothetical protein
MPTDQWYFGNANGIQGPLSLDKLRELVLQGRLGPTDQVRRGNGEWREVKDVGGLDFCTNKEKAEKARWTERAERVFVAAGCLTIIGVAAVCVGVFRIGGEGDDHPVRAVGQSGKTIPYDVLEKKSRADGKQIMSLLVSETESREDVMKLADSIRREHGGKIASISIFDSREAWRRHLDETYPETELTRHWLVQIGDGLGGEDVRWVAKERR